MKRKAIPKAVRLNVYNKYDGHCAYCGKKIAYKDMQVDHLIPQRRASLGGRGHIDIELIETEENYMPACRKCNHYKRANKLETFRRYIEEIPKKLSEGNYIYKIGKLYGLIEEKPRKIKFYYELVEEEKRND